MRNNSPRFPSGSDRSGLAGGLQGLISALQPPEWMIDELQNRVVLFLNHVLIQEPQAQDRLRRQVGKPVRMQWGEIHLTLAATPAGLVERVAPESKTESHRDAHAVLTAGHRAIGAVRGQAEGRYPGRCATGGRSGLAGGQRPLGCRRRSVPVRRRCGRAHAGESRQHRGTRTEGFCGQGFRWIVRAAR